MIGQSVSGISPVQVIMAYGGTQSDVSSLEKQRDRLMLELDRVNAGQSSEAVPYRREQLQRQIQLLEVQLARKAGSSTATDVSTAFQNVQGPLMRTEWKGFLKGIGQTDPRTATVNAAGRFEAFI